MASLVTTTVTGTLTTTDDIILTGTRAIKNTTSAGVLTIQGGQSWPGGRIILGGGNAAGGDIKFYTGLSTDAPTERLEINATGAATFSVQNLNVDHNNAAIDLKNGSGTSLFRAELGGNLTYLSTIGAYNMVLRTNQITALTLDSSQNASFGGTISCSTAYTTHVSIATGSPILVMKDTDSTGAAQVGYVSFQNSGGTEKGWIGYGSGGNTHLTIKNGHTSSQIVLDAPTTSVTGNLTVNSITSYSGSTTAFDDDVIIGGANATTSNLLYFHDTGGQEWYMAYDGGLKFVESGVTQHVKFVDGGQVLIGSATYTGGKLMVSNSDNTVYDASQASHQRDNGSTLMINNESTTAGSFSQVLLRNRSSDVGGCRIVSIDSGANDSELAIVTGDTNESMRILGNGRVGIGTATPTALLEVEGSAAFNDGAYGTNAVKVNGNNFYSNTVTVNDSYTAAFDVNCAAGLSQSFIFTVKGTIGNTVIPATVEVQSNHYQDITIRSQAGNYTTLTVKVTTANNEDCTVWLKANTYNGGDTTCYVTVQCSAGGTVDWSSVQMSGTTLEHTCRFGFSYSCINGSDTSRFLMSGNMSRLALGSDDGMTSEPANQLCLYTASGNSIIDIEQTGNGNTSGINFIRQRSSGTGVNGGSIFMDSNTGSNNAALYIQAQSASAGAGVTTQLTGSNGARIILRGGEGIIQWETGAAERMRITASGSVGIGTNDPGAILHADGNVIIGDDDRQTTQLTIKALNTAGAPASSTRIIMQGYEGRGIGTFYTDSSYAGQQWFCGMNYASAFGFWNIGYDASGDQAEYSANTLFRVRNTGRVEMLNYGSGTFTGTAAYKLAVDSSGNIIETAVGAGQVDGSGTASNVALWSDTDTIGNSIITQSGTAYVQVGGGVRITGDHTDTGSQLNIWCDASGHGRAAVYDWYFYTGGNSARNNLALFLGPTGSVGIGDSNPDHMLSIISGGHGFMAVDAAAGYDSGLLVREAAADKWLIKNEGSNNSLQLYNYAEAMVNVQLDPDGDVWLGNSINGSGTTYSPNKVVIQGYSVQYDSGGTGHRLTNTGFLLWHTGGGWTGNERMWAFTNAYNMGTAPKFALIRGNSNSVIPTLGNSGSLGTNTELTAYWTKDDEFYNAGDGHFNGVVRVDTGLNHNGTTVMNSSRELINIAELAINAAAAGSNKLYCNGDANINGDCDASTFTGNGAALTSLNASNLSSGTVPTARLGSGTASSSTYLRGDNTWATVSGGGGDTVSITASADDILSVSSGAISGVDAGSSDKIVFWDNSASKLTYLGASTGISISGTSLSVGSTVCTAFSKNSPSGSYVNPSSNYITFAEGTGITLGFSGSTITFSSGTSSDYRLKKNISTFNSEAWAKVKSVNLRKFDFDEDAFKVAIDSPDKEIDSEPKDYTDNLGFIAHELAEAGIKGAVIGDKDGIDSDGNFIYQKVNHISLVPVLWGALNEAISKIETLESKVQALEDK